MVPIVPTPPFSVCLVWTQYLRSQHTNYTHRQKGEQMMPVMMVVVVVVTKEEEENEKRTALFTERLRGPGALQTRLLWFIRHLSEVGTKIILTCWWGNSDVKCLKSHSEWLLANVNPDWSDFRVWILNHSTYNIMGHGTSRKPWPPYTSEKD